MKRASVWTLVAGMVVLAAVLLTRTHQGASASTLGRGALGWRGLGLLLERRDVEVRVLDRALEHGDPLLGPPPGAGGDRPVRATLVVGFPWQRGDLGWNPAPVLGFVRRGGRLVLGTSNALVLSWPETRLLDALEVERLERPRTGPLRPLRWWRERRAGDRWSASPTVPWREPLVTGELAAIARPSAGSETTPLATDERGHPVASILEVGEGEVWLVPFQALANAYLGEPGNAALALALMERIEGPVVIDEYHHGLLSAEAQLAEPAGRAFDAVVAQLALLWLLAVLAFAWRFGPPWPTTNRPADAHRAFLVGLGALHQRLGHQRQAATELVRRVAAYDPAAVPQDELDERLAQAESVPFDELARELSRRRTPTETRRRNRPALRSEGLS